MSPAPPTPTITHVQYLQLLGQDEQAERHVRQLAEIRVVVALLPAANAESDLDDVVSDAIFGTTDVDQLLAKLGITVALPSKEA